jgi:hypothetical protein
MASAAPSVAPDVKTMSCGRAPSARATRSRETSRRSRAARPAPWTDDGLPNVSSATRTASFASGRTGVIAL